MSSQPPLEPITLRYGWFMPRRPAGGSADAREMKDHWKMFTENRFAQEFQPSPAQDQFIASKLRGTDGRFQCLESYCVDGMFVPPICSARHRRCATLLAPAPGNDSEPFVEPWSVMPLDATRNWWFMVMSQSCQ